MKDRILFLDQVGYKLFQNILYALYIVYIGLLLFISYELHLVELCCSKSASLWKATTVIISSARITSRKNNNNIAVFLNCFGSIFDLIF